MKKILLFIALLVSAHILFAQKKDWSKIDLSNRPGDHLMIQLSTDYWTGAPDSIKNHIGGLSRGGNIYFMIDKPFKSNPRLSIAFGAGVGTSNIYFKKMSVDIKATGSVVPFRVLDTTDRFKKYKLTTAYLEAPIELRFTADPLKYNKSIKAAIGVKVGTLLNAHTKGKTLENKDGRTINAYTLKESKKNFFNNTRLAVTARLGYGNFSLFGAYQIGGIFKDGTAPDIKPLQVGISLSGL
jgi:hypothetical protein